MTGLASLVNQLLNPACYDHPVDRVELIETHISWIFLAGDYAYKLKKPIDLGFLDFSTLDKRHFYCREELRLNRAFAPDLYLDVVPIGGDKKNPLLGQTPAIDYLVKMKRFDQRLQLDRLLAEQHLSSAQLTAFAEKIAEFHSTSAPAPPTRSFGSYEAIMQPVLNNFCQIRKIMDAEEQLERLAVLEHWSRKRGEELQQFFEKRRLSAAIRECHGDMHLRNMAWIDNKPVLFDCIEFNPSLRIIDTFNDIAFLIMDLDDRGQKQLAWTFLDSYLLETGDFSGLEGLNFYLVYRAMVRAKVCALQLSQQPEEQDRDQLHELFVSYLELATSYLKPPRPRLILTHGFSGSGKTTFSRQLAPLIKAICLHSDRERKRTAEQLGKRAINGEELYSDTSREAAYEYLAQQTDSILSAGYSVIIDATFISMKERQRFGCLAAATNTPMTILDFPADSAELKQRLGARKTIPDRFSDADEQVLALQMQKADPLTPEEEQICLKVSGLTKPESILVDLN